MAFLSLDPFLTSGGFLMMKVVSLSLISTSDTKPQAAHFSWIIWISTTITLDIFLNEDLKKASKYSGLQTETTEIRMFLVWCTMHTAKPSRHRPVLFSRRRKTLSKQLNCSQMDNSLFKHERNFNVTPSPWNLLQQILQDS
ncbi:hypothetical protein CR513_58816 [Mucuna pruriens]|uniref:Uncharacterized protein n=1 Tax=Mucuna pruriens TaxID=157652 RepID=A0A371E9W6_MUCPR|nr:hypothetical protein CR513_58816 [Mucuna pruriens]